MTTEEEIEILSRWAKKRGKYRTFVDDDGSEQIGLLELGTLDGMWELEELLRPTERKFYTDTLVGVARRLKDGEARSASESDFVVVHAKADLRREAMLRFIGKWKDK